MLSTLLLGFGAAAPCSAGSTPGSLEMAIKASYLYKFAPFVRWPPRSFASATSPLRICIAGDNALSSLVDEAVRGQRMDDHPITVTRLTVFDQAAAANCQILFLGAGAVGRRHIARR